MGQKNVVAFRRQARQAVGQTAQALVPAIETAIKNEQITRGRVDALEAVRNRALLGRLRWLILGR